MGKLFSRLYYFFFYQFIKLFYSLQYAKDGVEEVYVRKNNIAVVVKNDEVGKNLYNILATLVSRRIKIESENISLLIRRFCATENNQIQIFSAKFKRDKNYNTELEKLGEKISFIESMQKNGFYLNEDKFEYDSDESFSTFLSLFDIDDENVSYSKAYLVRYIHYVLSHGENMEDFYQKTLKDKVFCTVSDFPYGVPIIGMCYNLFKFDIVPENIYEVIKQEKVEQDYGVDHYRDLILVSLDNLKSKTKNITQDEDGTIYDGEIVIYKDVSSDFARFIRDSDSSIFTALIEVTIEHISQIIIDPTGKIIGVKVSSETSMPIHHILDEKSVNQHEILDFITLLSRYLLDISSWNKDDVSGKNDFDVEHSVLFTDDNKNKFKISKIKDLFNLVTDDEKEIKNKITVIFFKIFDKYIKQKYGDVSDVDSYYKLNDVRFLNPIVAREFVNFALGNDVNYSLAANELFGFIETYRETSAINGFSYDSRFYYDPYKVGITFDYEVKEKYGIETKGGSRTLLDDGRTVVIFDKSKKIERLVQYVNDILNTITSKVGSFDSDVVHFAEFSEVIYSRDLKNGNQYDVIGYITKSIEGKALTDEVLLEMNNKDLIFYFAHIVLNYGYSGYYIDSKFVFMDNNHNFTINIFDEDFKVDHDRGGNYCHWLYMHLKSLGNDFFYRNDIASFNKNDLLTLYNKKLNKYCPIHNFYYNGNHSETCPICARTNIYLTFSQNRYFNNINRRLKSLFFEDDIATHYCFHNPNSPYEIFDGSYIIKIYKNPEFAEKVKNNISKIVYQNLTLYQACFIPEKALYNSSNKFIGYIYRKFNFSTFVDVESYDQMENLPRIMSLIRLMHQIKDLADNNIGFSQNPFGKVFLSKDFKKQVQIANIELLTKVIKTDETFRWTVEYVNRVLSGDPNIDWEYCDDFETLLEKLINLSKELTKHCSIHKFYYKKKFIFCPKCIDQSCTDKMHIQFVDKDSFDNVRQNDEGGEALIYNLNNREVLKIFKRDIINYDFKCRVISKVFSKIDALSSYNGKELKYKFVIPKSVYVDSDSYDLLGYSMDKVENAFPLSNLKDKVEVKNLGFERKDILEILISVGQGIEALHSNNIYIGDLNGRNILVDRDKNVYFLDFDGMGIDELMPMFCTDGYIDPLSKKRNQITMDDDWYSFAVQAFYYLTYTHPFNGLYSEEGHNLDIPTKMERRISLLGSHGMEPPAMHVPWTWMDKDLLGIFYAIFEKEDRTDITPYITKQYSEVYGGDVLNVNNNFIATHVNPFGVTVESYINHFSAFRVLDGKLCISVLYDEVNKQIFDIFENDEISYINEVKDVVLSNDKRYVLLIFDNRIVCLKINGNFFYEVKAPYSEYSFAISDNCIYYTSKVPDIYDFSIERELIHKIDLDTKKHSKINFMPDQRTQKFAVKDNSKFVFVKSISDEVDAIYCNSYKIAEIMRIMPYSKYKILYDDLTKTWLVINSEGTAVTINETNGKKFEFDLSNFVDEENFESVFYHKGVVYSSSNEYLNIIIVLNGKMVPKKMECRKIMTPKTMLFDVDTDGFSVYSDSKMYVIRKK